MSGGQESSAEQEVLSRVADIQSDHYFAEHTSESEKRVSVEEEEFNSEGVGVISEHQSSGREKGEYGRVEVKYLCCSYLRYLRQEIQLVLQRREYEEGRLSVRTLGTGQKIVRITNCGVEVNGYVVLVWELHRSVSSSRRG